MKTKEELNSPQKEINSQNKKLHELTEKELEQVFGGVDYESATGTYKITCSTPGCIFNLDIEPTCWDPNIHACPICKTGTLSFIFTPYKK